MLLVLGTAAAYFIGEYGIVIDASMLQNVAETNPSEARDVLTPKLVTFMLGLGVSPARPQLVTARVR